MRVLGKPGVLEKQDQWQDWSFVTRAYVTTVDHRFKRFLEAIAGLTRDQEPLLMTVAMDEGQRQLANALMHVLTMTCEGRALMV
eukprot:13519462-Alexandrium_andersonii.AAC.1